MALVFYGVCIIFNSAQQLYVIFLSLIQQNLSLIKYHQLKGEAEFDFSSLPMSTNSIKQRNVNKN
jgi:hypothetical protein